MDVCVCVYACVRVSVCECAFACVRVHVYVLIRVVCMCISCTRWSLIFSMCVPYVIIVRLSILTLYHFGILVFTPD